MAARLAAPALARLLFFAAWVGPTIALLFGDLPPARIIAAVGAAALSGALLAALPPAGFRVARLLTTLLFPLSWRWIAYVALNGSGPSAIDALLTLVNTNVAESSTALRLMLSGQAISIGLLQLSLLAASYLCGVPRFSMHSRAVFAGTLLVVMITAWIRVLAAPAPGFLPSRSDWQNFPYGSMADIVVAGLADPDLLQRRARTIALKRRAPSASSGTHT